MHETNDAADKEQINEEMKIQKSMEKPLTFDEDGKSREQKREQMDKEVQ